MDSGTQRRQLSCASVFWRPIAAAPTGCASAVNPEPFIGFYGNSMTTASWASGRLVSRLFRGQSDIHIFTLCASIGRTLVFSAKDNFSEIWNHLVAGS